MRILFVSTIESHWGGSEVLWSEAALAARIRGWEAAAFFPYHKNIPQIRRLAEAGVLLSFGTAAPERWWRRVWRPNVAKAERFRRTLAGFSPDLVVINQGGVVDGRDEMRACLQQKRPYAILNQSVGPLFYNDTHWTELRDLFARARSVWCVSRENLETLRGYLGLPLAHADAFSNAYGCPFDVSCPWPSASPVWRLASVARIVPEQKGQDLLFDVLARPDWRARASEFEVTLFGDGDCRAQLEHKRARLRLDHVKIAGRPLPIADIWGSHHALLLPSRYEGQSLAMIEAMLHGRPVIANPVGGTSGVVIDGATGFLARRTDADGFAEALDRAWLRREEWRQIGETARAHIRTVVSAAPGDDLLARAKAALSVTGRPDA